MIKIANVPSRIMAVVDQEHCFCPTIFRDEEGNLHEIVPDVFPYPNCFECPEFEKHGGKVE